MPTHSLYLTSSTPSYVYQNGVVITSEGEKPVAIQIGVPSVPFFSIATGNTSITLNFQPGNLIEVPIITDYQYSLDGGVTFTTMNTIDYTQPYIIRGLTNGITYQFQMKALNADGYGTASASYPFTNQILIPPSITPLYDITTISGLTNWYDASNPQNNGIIPSNGASVNTWFDKSTNANNMVVAQNASGISYNLNSQNGLGTISINNSWYRALTANASYPLDTYVVVKLNSLVNTTGGLMDIISTGSKTTDNFIGLSYGDIAYKWYNASTSLTKSSGTYSSINENSTGFLLMQWSVANNNFYIYRNGVQISSSTAYTYTIPADQELRLGFRQYSFAPANIFQGSMAEVVVYNNQLGTANRQKVEGYLAWKWGINSSLPDTHPYYNSPP